MSNSNEAQIVWKQVDDYFEDMLCPVDPILKHAVEESEKHGLPPHQVAPNQGKLLEIFSHMIQARKILEIGTLGAYSTIHLARSVQERNGKVISLEFNPKHATVARENVKFANLQEIIEIREGKAAELMQGMIDNNEGPFDLIFIDADKPSNPIYLELSLQLSKSGSIIIGDNVVRNGQVVNDESQDANVIGVRQFMKLMKENPKLKACTALQTVGCKGYDGFSIAIVK
ncbi:predicted protein [Naegleria gruberi]|uniref:Predicted protein n=1 Tax=Naegleria gruberi TaxID=5762 RepID=D2VAL7_NAEGR|nr:uncharacterized protein NAEGRDRAFT_65902 [Naegleria gruberi]EFC45975.1 predicted protein [Naegleria gruberi]|eukprot:XP_002678719.1 predicted protein [Naegleria gruberi strain NEG-M]